VFFFISWVNNSGDLRGELNQPKLSCPKLSVDLSKIERGVACCGEVTLTKTIQAAGR